MSTLHSLFNQFRDALAVRLGVASERKETIYLEIAQSASLDDPSYWLQVIFSAGIATLGLVLNSVAVIIGAMLISPLMGPILAGGLALATGDLALGMRALVSLGLSCLAAILLAMTLVAFLPFKELTSEIAARIQPSVLDLAIALFSGAVGSVAICRETKGVMTSIPGVSIAVALMPPLCVVGYGLGLSISASGGEGLVVARGGGLLFLTNLVAITFAAMIVFLLLHIDTVQVRQRVKAWRIESGRTGWLDDLLVRLPGSRNLGRIGSLPGRFLMIVVILGVLMIPLSRSFERLSDELARKQRDNWIDAAAREIWQRNFAELPNGESRSYISAISMRNLDGRLSMQLRLVTSEPYKMEEKVRYTQMLAGRLDMAPDSVLVQFVEIPTTSSERDEKEIPIAELLPMTVAQLQASFLGSVLSALHDLELPPDIGLLDYELSTGLHRPFALRLVYLASREIDPDARALLGGQIRRRVGVPTADVTFEQVRPEVGPFRFEKNEVTLQGEDSTALDAVGTLMNRYPSLRVTVVGNAKSDEPEGIASVRVEAVVDRLTRMWRIAADRIDTRLNVAEERSAVAVIRLPAK